MNLLDIPVEHLYQGTQVAYIPNHVLASADYCDALFDHPDTEYGFIMSYAGGGHYFCRYFYRENGRLRTTANSERTRADNLFPLPDRYQKTEAEINQIMADIHDSTDW